MSRPAYDMLVIDLDGTLLAPDGSVSEANRRALDRARAAGIELVIATGRAFVESERAIRAAGHVGPVITAGGSMLSDAATGRTIRRHAMPVELVARVTATLLPHGHKVLLLKDSDVAGYDYLAVGEGDLDPTSEWWFETLEVRVRYAVSIADDPHPHDTMRAGAVAASNELAPIARHLAREIGEAATLQHWSAVTANEATGSDTHLLEVFNAQVSKWTMVEALCAERGVPRKRVAAIGDGLNDVELVREAGLGIAMGNADPRVRAVAGRVTADSTSDGVAKAVEMILGGRW